MFRAGAFAALLVLVVVASGALAASDGITGFGATNVAWNRTHIPDPSFAPGSVYDADPSLPSVNGHMGAHYTTVLHENGRVLGYEYHFTNRPISAAMRDVLRTQFPADAKTAWFVTKGACSQMMVTSATLGRALSTKAIGDRAGAAMVEFGSGSYGGGTYNPRSIDDALFLLLGLVPRSQAPGC